MTRKFFATAMLISLVAIMTPAQTGKISGKIIDRESNQILIGANVLIEGIGLGAASDVEGNYHIFNIPPGNYSLKASYLGYQDVVIENVNIPSGLTVTVDFRLPARSVETQTVVIVSERPLIQKSATNAVRIVNSEDLETLPVRSIDAVVALQAGVVRQNGVTYIRGSRANETGYLLEGASVKNVEDPNGGSVVELIPDAVAEIQVQAGGFSAEYGNANAGIISSDLKTGTNKYHFMFRAETDNFGNYPGKKFLGTYSYGYTDYTFTISGPVLSDKVKLFIAGENRFNRDSNPMFFEGNPTAYYDGALFDTTRAYTSLLGGGNPNDSYILSWPGGNILGDMRNEYILNGSLLFDIKPLLLRISGSFSYTIGRDNSNSIINYFDLNRLPYYKTSNDFLNLKGTYLLSANSFIEAYINYADNRSKNYDQLFGDNYLAYGDSLANAQKGYPNFRSFTIGPATDYVYGFPFRPNGMPLAGYGFYKWISWGAGLAYTAQIGKHELKVGGSLQLYIGRNYGVGRAAPILSRNLLADALINPDYARDPEAWKLYLQQWDYASFIGLVGYDFFGNEVDSGPFSSFKPVIGGTYIEDKLEISDLIISAGIRFDYINMDSWKLKNPANPSYELDTKLIPDSEIVAGTKYQYLSPHLGFSFPITDRTVFHFQYGKYVQAPALRSVYSGPLFLTYQLIAGFAIVNPTAFDPEPIRTTQYEVGFTQQFTDFAAFDITAYYKDITGQLQYAIQKTVAGAKVASYDVLKNQDFATTKGIEISLRLRRVNRIRAQINYTYSNAKGTNSYRNSAFGSIQTNGTSPTVIQKLEYDQAHRGSFILDYRFGNDDGGPILQRMGINLLFTFNSGHAFTPSEYLGLGQAFAWSGALTTDTRARIPTGPINSGTTPWVYQLDLRIDKTIKMLDNFDVNFYVIVTNVLNTKNVINVYNVTGNAYDDGYFHSEDVRKVAAGPIYTQRFLDLYKALNLTNRQSAIVNLGYDLFGVPRQLRAGLAVNF